VVHRESRHHILSDI